MADNVAAYGLMFITRMDLGGILTYLHIQRYNGRKLDSLGLSFLVSWLDSHNPKKRVASNFFLYLRMTVLRSLIQEEALIKG